MFVPSIDGMFALCTRAYRRTSPKYHSSVHVPSLVVECRDARKYEIKLAINMAAEPVV